MIIIIIIINIINININMDIDTITISSGHHATSWIFSNGTPQCSEYATDSLPHYEGALNWGMQSRRKCPFTPASQQLLSFWRAWCAFWQCHSCSMAQVLAKHAMGLTVELQHPRNPKCSCMLPFCSLQNTAMCVTMNSHFLMTYDDYLWFMIIFQFCPPCLFAMSIFYLKGSWKVRPS